jgi:glutamyl/glutaminyl-tRNA synthetase
VLSAIYVWGITRALGGQVLLRIEDHDRQRSRRELEAAILDDLEWLGFVPDAPSLTAFRRGRCDGRQSDRDAIYAAAFAGLRDRGLVYACECSRKDLTPSPMSGAERRYPGTCAEKHLPMAPGFGVRLRTDSTVETFDDVRWGRQVQTPSLQCGDLLLQDREGNWTYQFCAAVDDLAQGITLIIRGDDLLPSTGRQLYLARLLGRRRPPVFLHHSLVRRLSGDKLSKSDGDTAVRDCRARGESAADVIGRAAHAGGLLASAQPIPASCVEHIEGLRNVRDAAQRAVRV